MFWESEYLGNLRYIAVDRFAAEETREVDVSEYFDIIFVSKQLFPWIFPCFANILKFLGDQL